MAEKKKFIQKAEKRMEEKGTKGKFGKATEKKIAAAKREGGVRKKEAVFAENMKKIAEKRKGPREPKREEKREPKREKKSGKRSSEGAKHYYGPKGSYSPHHAVAHHESRPW